MEEQMTPQEIWDAAKKKVKSGEELTHKESVDGLMALIDLLSHRQPEDMEPENMK